MRALPQNWSHWPMTTPIYTTYIHYPECVFHIFTYHEWKAGWSSQQERRPGLTQKRPPDEKSGIHKYKCYQTSHNLWISRIYLDFYYLKFLSSEFAITLNTQWALTLQTYLIMWGLILILLNTPCWGSASLQKELGLWLNHVSLPSIEFLL